MQPVPQPAPFRPCVCACEMKEAKEKRGKEEDVPVGQGKEEKGKRDEQVINERKMANKRERREL